MKGDLPLPAMNHNSCDSQKQEEAADSEICLVGYAMNAKKLRKSETTDEIKPSDGWNCNHSTSPSSSTGKVWRGGGIADILASKSDNIQFHSFDHEISLHNQPKYHIIIHKLTEDIDRRESSDRINALENYLRMNPRTILVDCINDVMKVTSRQRAVKHLHNVQKLHGDLCPFQQPRFLLLENYSDTQCWIEGSDIESKLRFPVIAKPFKACGTPLSHHMMVIMREEDIHMIHSSFPCVVQEYYNHYGVLFKVYVIDNDVMVYKRASLPDLHKLSDSGSLNPYGGYKSIAFDSRHNYPTLEDFVTNVDDSANQNSNSERLKNFYDTVAERHYDVFRNTAKVIQEEFKLSLFGFDVIIPIESIDLQEERFQIMVIDVNYFPSYKEVADFPERLKRYLRKLAFGEQQP